MRLKIGQIIKEESKNKGLSQAQLGQLIRRTKQGVASLFRRSSIDVDMIITISDKLEKDLLAKYYEIEPMRRFKEAEILDWELKIKLLKDEILMLENHLKDRQELVETQRKLIMQLENKK